MEHNLDDKSRQQSPHSNSADSADFNCVEHAKESQEGAVNVSGRHILAQSNELSDNHFSRKTLRLRRPSSIRESVQGTNIHQGQGEDQDQATRNRSSSKERKTRGIEQVSNDQTTQGQTRNREQTLPGILVLLWAWALEVVEASGWGPDHTSLKEATRTERSNNPRLADHGLLESSRRQRMSQSQARTILEFAFAVVVIAVAKSGYLPVAFFLCVIASPLIFIV